MDPAGNQSKRLSSVNHTTKTSSSSSSNSSSSGSLVFQTAVVPLLICYACIWYFDVAKLKQQLNKTVDGAL